MRTEGAEVEVLVAGDAADARLPPPVLVVPACVDNTHAVIYIYMHANVNVIAAAPYIQLGS